MVRGLVFYFFEIYILSDRLFRSGSLRFRRRSLLVGLLLHIPELLADVFRCSGYGYKEIEHEPVEQVEYDCQKKDFR